jgi:PAS domain S-box-containing protein
MRSAPVAMPAAPARILVVEDEGIVALNLRRSLTGLGYEVVGVAATAADALELASKGRPDLVLMDIHIRGNVDGIDAAVRLREQGGAPVVFLTAYADESTVERAKQAAPYGYLVKPFSAPELRTTIETALHRHQRDRALVERERRLTQVLAAMADGVVATDAAGNVTYANDAAIAMLGLAAADTAGATPVEDLFTLVDDDGHRLANPARTAADECRTVELPAHGLVTRGGARLQVGNGAAPVIENGKVIGAVLSIHDDSERRRQAQDRVSADRVAALGTLAAGLGHELNNPLSYVATSLEYLRRNLAGAPAPMLEAASDAIEGVTRIGAIARDLQIFWTHRDQLLDADPRAATAWAIRVAGERVRARGHLVTQLGEAPVVSARGGRLEQIALNLLVHVGDAIPDTDQPHEIAVSTGMDERGWAVIEVRDGGAELAPEVARQVFEPFRVGPTRDGHGDLGLAVAHHIVTGLGGGLTCEVVPGAGTTYRAVLPPSLPRPRIAPVPTVRPRVLLVDDEPLVLRSVTRMLRRSHSVVSAGSGREALALLAGGERFDAILTDLHMPGMSGRDLAASIESVAPDQAARVVMVTGGTACDDTARFLDDCANPPLYKPFQRAALTAAVDAVIAATAGQG